MLAGRCNRPSRSAPRETCRTARRRRLDRGRETQVAWRKRSVKQCSGSIPPVGRQCFLAEPDPTRGNSRIADGLKRLRRHYPATPRMVALADDFSEPQRPETWWFGQISNSGNVVRRDCSGRLIPNLLDSTSCFAVSNAEWTVEGHRPVERIPIGIPGPRPEWKRMNWPKSGAANNIGHCRTGRGRSWRGHHSMTVGHLWVPGTGGRMLESSVSERCLHALAGAAENSGWARPHS